MRLHEYELVLTCIPMRVKCCV